MVKKQRKPATATGTTEVAGGVNGAGNAVHCTNCGYFAGSGVAGDPCPVCKQLLAFVPPKESPS